MIFTRTTIVRSLLIAWLWSLTVRAEEPSVEKVRATSDRPRLIVLTDIGGGDPDDQRSMIRLMLHSNELDIEGLIATAPTLESLKDTGTKPQLIREIVDAYGQVRENLARHADGFPEAARQRDVIKSGNPKRGRDAIGDGHDSHGSRWIVTCADRPDARRLNIAIWGGQTDLAQALYRIQHDRGAEGLKSFAAKVRVYDIGDQDRIVDWMLSEFPGLFYIAARPPAGRDRRGAAYRGLYLGGDESLVSRLDGVAHPPESRPAGSHVSAANLDRTESAQRDQGRRHAVVVSFPSVRADRPRSPRVGRLGRTLRPGPRPQLSRRDGQSRRCARCPSHRLAPIIPRARSSTANPEQPRSSLTRSLAKSSNSPPPARPIPTETRFNPAGGSTPNPLRPAGRSKSPVLTRPKPA